MKQPIVIIGIGEMGGVFARGFLRYGHPVFPVTRLMDIRKTAVENPDPVLVLVAVAENDLRPVLEIIPEPWQDRIGLLQNELLPRDWQARDLDTPTVISVWFEKKKGRDYKVLIPSPIYGPNARIIKESLELLDIPCRILTEAADLLFELVRKNLYILTTNIAGLVSGGTVGELWDKHNALALAVAGEVLDIQEWLATTRLPRARLVDGMVEAIQAGPAHLCTGRSAPARLERALKHADDAGLAVPKLREIQAES